MTTYLYLKDGVVHANEFPEEPTVKQYTTTHGYASEHRFESFHEDMFNSAMRDYKNTVSSLKASGAKVIGNNEKLYQNGGGWDIDYSTGAKEVSAIRMKPDVLYRVPAGWKVEYGYQYYTSEMYYGSDAKWVECTEDQYNSVMSIRDSKTRKIARLVRVEEEKIIDLMPIPLPKEGDFTIPVPTLRSLIEREIDYTSGFDEGFKEGIKNRFDSRISDSIDVFKEGYNQAIEDAVRSTKALIHGDEDTNRERHAWDNALCCLIQDLEKLKKP